MQRMLVPFRMHNSGWLLILFCGVLGVSMDGWKTGLAAGVGMVASLLLHEVGHIAMAAMRNVPVREVGLGMKGAYIRRVQSASRRDEIYIAAAGPLTNFLLAFPLLLVPQIGAQLALCNLLLCIVNLLPIPASDGLRILRNIWNPASLRTPSPVVAAATAPSFVAPHPL